jgi:hypothetical protein
MLNHYIVAALDASVVNSLINNVTCQWQWGWRGRWDMAWHWM